MPPLKQTGGGSKAAPAAAVKAQKAEQKITPTVAKAKVEAAKAVALKATKADDKKTVQDAKKAIGLVVGTPAVVIPPSVDPPSGNNKNKSSSSTSGGDGGTTVVVDPAPIPKPIPTPPPPPPSKNGKELGAVKNPSRDVLNISSLIPQASPERIAEALFEQFSAIELSNVLRHDTVDGINQRYLIISNLSEIRRRYETTKALTVMDKLNTLTSVFAIDLDSKIPQEEYSVRNNLNDTYQYLDENNVIQDVQKGYVYIDSNGDLIIELDNMQDNEIVQVQIDTNGTIYKVES